MKFVTKFIMICTIISLSYLNSSYAQVKRAQVGFRFLENPVSAEVMGRGGVGVTTTFTSNAIFWNPALLGEVPNNIDISLNRTQGIADINYNSIGASIHLGDFGVLGLSLLAMDYGTFYQTMRAANDQGYVETGTFSPTAIAVGVAFSQKVSERFSYGIHLKYARQDLGSAWIATSGDSLGDQNLLKSLQQKKYVLGTIAADVGTFYDFQYNGITFGATIYNVSRSLAYENENFPLPFSVSFSATVQPLRFVLDNETARSIILSFESNHPRDYRERVKFGAEYHFFDMFTARAGYMVNYDERSWTAGIGVKANVSGIPIRVDYALEPFGLFGNVNYISLGFAY